MQLDKLLKEIAVLKAQAETKNGNCMAYLNALLPTETGLDETVYELVLCYSKKPTKIMHFRKEENALAYLHEHIQKNPPQKGFVFYVDTGMLD